MILNLSKTSLFLLGFSKNEVIYYERLNQRKPLKLKNIAITDERPPLSNRKDFPSDKPKDFMKTQFLSC